MLWLSAPDDIWLEYVGDCSEHKQRRVETNPDLVEIPARRDQCLAHTPDPRCRREGSGGICTPLAATVLSS
jgi:hypothetical protein